MKRNYSTIEVSESPRARLKSRAPILTIALLVIFSPALAQKTGLSFLKLGVGARSVAMGEAYTAVANDASATYYNPAGLVAMSKTDIMMMHKEWVEGVKTDFLGIRIPFERFAVGLGINTTNVGDIQLRTRPGPADGKFSSHDFALGVSIAVEVNPSISAGATVKFLYEKIFVDEASGAAVDVGLLYRAPFEGLKFGISASNLGSMGSLRDEKIKLPSLLRLGTSYERELEFVRSRLTAAADLVKILQENKTHFHSGAELSYEEIVSLRLGYLFGYESRGMTIGIGLHKNPIRVDYSFNPHSQSLSNGHTISLGVEF